MNKTDKAAKESLEGLQAIRDGLIVQIRELQSAKPVDQNAVGEALRQLKTASDLYVTERWVSEIQHAIQSNPSLALPPTGSQGTLARKLANLRQQEERRKARDQRKGENKQRFINGLPVVEGSVTRGTE